MSQAPHPAKSVLAARRLTQRQLAQAVGVNENTFGRIINGYVTPWPAFRRRLADALALPESDLFHGGDA